MTHPGKSDTLVLLIIRHHGREKAKNVLWSHTGSPLIPLEELMEPAVRQRYDMPHDPEVFDMLNAVSRQKELGVVVKMNWGDPRELYDAVREEVNLERLVMGNLSLGLIQRYFSEGHVSSASGPTLCCILSPEELVHIAH